MLVVIVDALHQEKIMAYAAVVEARKAAEVNQERVREAVRLGFELKREQEQKKAAQEAARLQAQAR